MPYLLHRHDGTPITLWFSNRNHLETSICNPSLMAQHSLPEHRLKSAFLFTGSSRGGGEEGNRRDSLPAGHHELDEPGVDADMLVPFRLNMYVWAV